MSDLLTWVVGIFYITSLPPYTIRSQTSYPYPHVETQSFLTTPIPFLLVPLTISGTSETVSPEVDRPPLCETRVTEG